MPNLRYTGHQTGRLANGLLVGRDDFQSSWAADKNDTDQRVTGSNPVLITAQRILWDLGDDFDLDDSAFTTPADGLWLLDGTISVGSVSGVDRIAIEIWRNGELWFTVAEKQPLDGNACLTFVCAMDCYLSAEHVFDLRIHLLGSGSESATILGPAEATAWGMTFNHFLNQTSPT